MTRSELFGKKNCAPRVPNAPCDLQRQFCLALCPFPDKSVGLHVCAKFGDNRSRRLVVFHIFDVVTP